MKCSQYRRLGWLIIVLSLSATVGPIPTYSQESTELDKTNVGLHYKNGIVLTYASSEFHGDATGGWNAVSVEDAIRYSIGKQEKSGVWSYRYYELRWSPTRRDDAGSMWEFTREVEAGPQGMADWFREVPAKGTGDIRACLSMHVIGSVFPLLPVFPGKDKAPTKVGDSWSMKVLPFAHYPGHYRKPHAPFALIEQKWEETLDFEGYRCARISFVYRDRWTFDQDAQDALEEAGLDARMVGKEYIVVWSGNVFFAIDEGIVVGEDASVEYQSGNPHTRVRLRSKRLLIDCTDQPIGHDQISITDWEYGLIHLGERSTAPRIDGGGRTE